MTKPAIKVEGLGKRYRIGQAEQANDTLIGTLNSWVSAPLRNFRRLRSLSRFGDDADEDVIWALREVSFSIDHGEVVGVIGSNGAGKSTLLKILSRITEPTTGRAVINGRVASLLEVGTGFHSELTGRENIYLNGTVLGMSKAEVRRKFDEIVAFSGVEKFIDTPVKRYSSGMRVRLAFAVAAHLEPEILLIDEVLAVGDVSFQKKCLGKMEDIANAGRTILFVSHDMSAITSLCGRALLFEDGQLTHVGSSSETVEKYLSFMSTEAGHTFRQATSDAPIYPTQAEVTAKGKSPLKPFDINDQLVIESTWRVREALAGSQLTLILRRQGQVLFKSFDTDLDARFVDRRASGVYRSRIELPQRVLKAGIYTVDLNAGITGSRALSRHTNALSFEVHEIGEKVQFKSYAKKRPGAIRMELDWNLESVSMTNQDDVGVGGVHLSTTGPSNGS